MIEGLSERGAFMSKGHTAVNEFLENKVRYFPKLLTGFVFAPVQLPNSTWNNGIRCCFRYAAHIKQRWH